MACSVATREVADEIGRRNYPRIHLSLPARFTSTTGNHKVLLENVSPAGANMTLPPLVECLSGTLHWLSYSAFADVAWQRGMSCGLVFTTTLKRECLNATEVFAEMVERHPLGPHAKLAAAWVYGPGDW